MAYELRVSTHPGYVHARVSGDRTPENALRFLEEVYAACVKHGCDAALLEMGLKGPSLGVSSIYDVITRRSPEGSRLRRIAYVEVEENDAQRSHFAETVAVNRGVNVRLFADVEAARRWIEVP